MAHRCRALFKVYLIRDQSSRGWQCTMLKKAVYSTRLPQASKMLPLPEQGRNTTGVPSGVRSGCWGAENEVRERVRLGATGAGSV